MSEDKKPDNMNLWNQVCTTDPAVTKKVNTRGGFTAIDAQAQIKKATELWGPYGGEWGVRDCDYRFFPDERKAEITLSAVFYYPHPFMGQEGMFEIATDMLYKPGNDSRKKLLTDLTTKALSKLGFNSDVFEGKFDDNKYVNDVKKKFSKKPRPEPIRKSQLKTIKKLITETDSAGELFNSYLKDNFAVVRVEDLSVVDADKLKDKLNKKLDKQNES